MDIAIEQANGVAVMKVSGRLDTISAPEYQEKFQELVAQGERRVAVDSTCLDYVSSAGLRSILIGLKAIKSAGGGLAFFGMPEVVQDVFRMTGFSNLFPILATREEALKELG